MICFNQLPTQRKPKKEKKKLLRKEMDFSINELVQVQICRD